MGKVHVLHYKLCRTCSGKSKYTFSFSHNACTVFSQICVLWLTHWCSFIIKDYADTSPNVISSFHFSITHPCASCSHIIVSFQRSSAIFEGLIFRNHPRAVLSKNWWRDKSNIQTSNACQGSWTYRIPNVALGELSFPSSAVSQYIFRWVFGKP